MRSAPLGMTPELIRSGKVVAQTKLDICEATNLEFICDEAFLPALPLSDV